LYNSTAIPASDSKLSARNRFRLTWDAAFFILLYLYLWLKVDPKLIYHGGMVTTNFHAFFRGRDFFTQSISCPGGLVEYLGAFLFQFFCYSWAGALVVAVQAWLICVCLDTILKTLNVPRIRWICFLPPTLLLFAYSQYTNYFITTMAMLTALIFICLYLKIRRNSTFGPLIIFLFLSVILYYLAGAAMLLFAAVCVIYELLFTRSRFSASACLLVALIIPYIAAVFIFNISIAEAFTDLLPLSHTFLANESSRRFIVIIYILYLLLPLTVLVFGVYAAFAKKSQTSDRLATASWCARMGMLKWTIAALLILAVAGSVLFLCHDNELKTGLEADYYTCHKMWHKVLKVAERYPDNYFIIHAVNRALYHTGQLPYKMFSYPQHPDALFLTLPELSRMYWKQFDIYISLGAMNIAEHTLVESMIAHGKRPLILKRLALVNMVKANMNSAEVYLRALSKTLFHARWANDYLRKLQADPNLAEDSEIQTLRRMNIERNYLFITYVNEGVLVALLEKNRQNKMAFEYLMAWYLLTKQLDKFANNLDRLDDFNYPQIPPVYEEAILIYETIVGGKAPLKGRKVSRQTYMKAAGFSKLYASIRGNSPAVAATLTEKDYGDTYFFYYTFGDVQSVK